MQPLPTAPVLDSSPSVMPPNYAGPCRALVVDDSAEFRDNVSEILTDGLSELGLTCATAGTAQAALALLDDDPIDVALLDLHLPDIPGTDLMREIRRRSPFAQVVVITGDSSVQSAIRALHRGAFAYLIKPFKSQELLETARRALEHALVMREREALRQELERSERRHREVIESVPAFVLALDADQRIVLLNRRFEEFTGFNRQDLLGKPASDLVGTSADQRLTLKNGEQRIIRWRLAPLEQPDAAGAATYAVGVDVTGEKEMERRTRTAERLAAVGTLAAGLAHEVRNPLNSASLQLQVLTRRLKKHPDAASHCEPIVDVVHGEIRRLDRLVNDFLAFARPRPLDLEPQDLNELLHKVRVLIEPEATETDVQIVEELAQAPSVAQVEAARIEQVLLNLTRNALEAMSDGGTLTLRTEHTQLDSGEPGIELSIEDTGPGFAEDAPVFDAFFTTKHHGTGLGLAIAHRIVGDHGGSILVSSRPGCTRFAIRLPGGP